MRNPHGFSYSDMQTVSRDGMRFYVLPNGGSFPSVTTVLGATAPADKIQSLENWRNAIGHEQADQITKDAGEHGTALHLLLERKLKGEQLVQEGEVFSDKTMGAFNSLKFLIRNITTVWCQEEALYSNVLGMAGRTDCIGEWNGVPAIIDFKTSRKIKSEADIGDYKLQLCAYAVMHNEMFGTDISLGVIIMAAGDGVPLVFKVELNEQVELLVDRVEQFYSKFKP